MYRRTIAAVLLAALTLAGAGAPGVASHAHAASCSSWTSESTPPPTIRVYRHATGAVETVDFKAYTKNVLSREWIGYWTAESLRSGALAVKSYAWYQVLHWRGGQNADGECFDLRDDTYDQVYDPSKATWSTAAAAVDATWATRVLKSGRIFPTYYNAGDPGETCGAHANGWKAFQWGTQACGLDGKSAAEIMLVYYYPGVTVTDAPAPTSTPTPTVAPTATPSPTSAATATEAPTSAPTSSPVPPTSTPIPTPIVTPVPTVAATPLPTPPPVQELPGGGQSNVANASAPPPPPSNNPTPVVVTPEPDPQPSFHGELRAWERSAAAMRRVLERSDPVVHGASAAGAAVAPTSFGDPRLTTFRLLWEQTFRDLLDGLAAGLSRPNSGLAMPWGHAGP